MAFSVLAVNFRHVNRRLEPLYLAKKIDHQLTKKLICAHLCLPLRQDEGSSRCSLTFLFCSANAGQSKLWEETTPRAVCFQPSTIRSCLPSATTVFVILGVEHNSRANAVYHLGGDMSFRNPAAGIEGVEVRKKVEEVSP